MWSKDACRRICNCQDKHEVLGHCWSTMERDRISCTMNAKFKVVKTYGACMLWARARQKFQADNDSSLWMSTTPLRGGDSFICQYYKVKSHLFQKKKIIYNCTMPKVCSLFKDNAPYHSTTKFAKRKEKEEKTNYKR